jgi:hypothetical protein
MYQTRKMFVVALMAWSYFQLFIVNACGDCDSRSVVYAKQAILTK